MKNQCFSYQSLNSSIMKTLLARDIYLGHFDNWFLFLVLEKNKKTKGHCLCASHRVGVRSHHPPRGQASLLGSCWEGVPRSPQEEAGSPSQESGSFCRSCCGGVCEVTEHCWVMVAAGVMLSSRCDVEMSELPTRASWFIQKMVVKWENVPKVAVCLKVKGEGPDPFRLIYHNGEKWLSPKTVLKQSLPECSTTNVNENKECETNWNMHLHKLSKHWHSKEKKLLLLMSPSFCPDKL